MAHKGWNWAYVKCPYYLRDDPKEKTVDCTGICDGAKKISTTFRRQEDFDIQMDVFCKERYRNCEIYQMLDKIYGDQ